MAWQDIANYIQQQLSAGYSIEQIRNVLLSYGYNPAEVNYAITYIQNSQYQAQLSQYIQQQLGQGYTLPQIKQFLISNGYDSNLVQNASSFLEPQKSSLKKPAIISAIVLVLLTLSITSAFFILHDNEPIQPQQMDISISTSQDSINIKDDLTTSIMLSNFGSDNRYDVHIQYTLTNKESGRSFSLGEEVVSIETRQSMVKEFDLPDYIESGWYNIKAEVTYSNLYDYAKTGDFYIENPEPTRNVTEEENITENITNESKKEPTETPEEDYSKLNMIEIMNSIESIADDNKKKALELCQSISYEIYKNDCLHKVAKSTGNSSVCKKINSDVIKDKCLSSTSKTTSTDACQEISLEGRRDLCYSDLAKTTGNYTYCNKVKSKAIRKSCKTLGSMEEREKTANAPRNITINNNITNFNITNYNYANGSHSTNLTAPLNK